MPLSWQLHAFGATLAICTLLGRAEQGAVTRRFGSRTAKQLVPIFDTLSDPERIAAVADAVLECETAEECIVRAREAAGMP